MLPLTVHDSCLSEMKGLMFLFALQNFTIQLVIKSSKNVYVQLLFDFPRTVFQPCDRSLTNQIIKGCSKDNLLPRILQLEKGWNANIDIK